MIDLVAGKDGKGGNFAPEFSKLNPYAQIPVLVIHEDGKPDLVLFQSLAIIEYLDEAFPNTRRMLPSDPSERVKVRIVSDCIASGIQPLQNTAILWEMD